MIRADTGRCPVIAIDGPSGSGKGTISSAIAQRLSWHYLDSGALYRVLGYLAHRQGVAFEDTENLVRIAKNLPVRFENGLVLLAGEAVDRYIRTEQAGAWASLVAPIPEVRETLLVWQRSQARPPGLVADGRDMGTVVFPHAECKIFLTASAWSRAKRRFNQLRDNGFDVNIDTLFNEINRRDERDANRRISPLKPAEDALYLDTTEMTIDEVIERVIVEARKVRLLDDRAAR